MFKLWLHDGDANEREVIRILDEFGRGRSRLISLALQDLIRRYKLAGKDKDTLRKFVDDFDFIRDFTANLEGTYKGDGISQTQNEPQISEEQQRKEEDKKAFDDLLSAFGANTF